MITTVQNADKGLLHKVPGRHFVQQLFFVCVKMGSLDDSAVSADAEQLYPQ